MDLILHTVCLNITLDIEKELCETLSHLDFRVQKRFGETSGGNIHRNHMWISQYLQIHLPRSTLLETRTDENTNGSPKTFGKKYNVELRNVVANIGTAELRGIFL